MKFNKPSDLQNHGAGKKFQKRVAPEGCNSASNHNLITLITVVKPTISHHFRLHWWIIMFDALHKKVSVRTRILINV